MSINEAALEAAYATYDSDPRVHGPDDDDAFRAGIAAYLAAVPEPSEAAFKAALCEFEAKTEICGAMFSRKRMSFAEQNEALLMQRDVTRLRDELLSLFRQAKGGAS